jgi:hypothetical protein
MKLLLYAGYGAEIKAVNSSAQSFTRGRIIPNATAVQTEPTYLRGISNNKISDAGDHERDLIVRIFVVMSVSGIVAKIEPRSDALLVQF